MSRYSNNRGFQLDFTDRKTQGIAAAAFVAVSAAGYFGISYLTDREGRLADWNPEYEQLCSDPSRQTDLNDSRSRRRVNQIFGMLNDVSFIGGRAEERALKDEQIFCFGNRYDENTEIKSDGWINAYLIDQDMDDSRIAQYLYNSELNSFHKDASDRTAKYITPHALLWSRARVAMRQVALLDAVYSINGADEEALRTSAWLRLQENTDFSAAAEAFKGVMIADKYDFNTARLAAFEASLASADAMNESDLSFLQWYMGKVDEDTIDVSCGENCTIPVPDPPPSWVHSIELAPETLKMMSEIYFGKSFISQDDAERIIETKENTIPRNARAQMMYNTSLRRAASYCRGHYTGPGDTEIGVGLSAPQPI